MCRLLSAIVVLCTLALGRATMAPKPFASTHRALKIRGGAGPLDPDLAAKVGIVVSGLQGAHGVLAPSKMAKMLGATSTDLIDAINEGGSSIVLSTALVAWMSIIRGESLNNVVGVGTIPGLVNCARSLLNEEETQLGVSTFGTWLTGAIYSAVAFACFTDAPYAKTAIQLYAIWGLMNGIALFSMPEATGSKGFGVSSSDASTSFALRGLGGVCVAKAVMVGALVQGVDPMKAFGYAWAVSLFNQVVTTFITKDVEKCGLDSKPIYFYVFLSAVLASTLVL